MQIELMLGWLELMLGWLELMLGWLAMQSMLTMTSDSSSLTVV
jgi:hypothetical protein